MNAVVDGRAVLVTIALSHYCEKARWALDRVGLPYREQPHVPLLHRLATARGEAGTVPVLVHGARRWADSTQILEHADAHQGGGLLYSRDIALRSEVAAWEERFDSELGPHTRRWAYAHLLPDAALMRRLWGHQAPRREAALLPLLMPLARRLVRAAYRITPDSGQRSLQRVHAVFAQVDVQLADGRPFLVGDRFSAADLTFAALAAPVLFPPECRAVMPALDAVPAAMRAQIVALRDSAAGRFGLRLYAQERGGAACAAPGAGG
jgi:glutathione S-transferase